MFLECIETLDADSLTCDDLFDELFSLEKESERLHFEFALETQAEKMKCKTKFVRMYRARDKELRKELKALAEEKTGMNRTDFSILPAEDQLACGDWVADDNGIWIHTDRGMVEACHHPILPVRVMRNAETGSYKVELAFYLRGRMNRTIVDRSVVASQTKIVQLANENVQVTSLNAPYLVKFLADIESLNTDKIKEVASTSRLGWITEAGEGGQGKVSFLPYDKEVVFDNELNTKALFDSIREEGDREEWYKTVLGIRQRKQIEVLINIAASFASVLVEPCGALPFIVSLWGGTGIGKTVVLMLATSIWADPSEGQYMTDAKATTTAMEIRLNILNSLPMTLDDMAQIKNQGDEDFSQLIYRWCAGKGRDRSNVNLGLNKLTSWRNCTITNGERSLVDETTQGGAVNRVIDIESDGSVLFSGDDGNRVANILRKNFGFAGKEFIRQVEEIGFTEITNIMNGYFKKIRDIAKEKGSDKEDKQVMPMALILTADELSERLLFHDGVRLDIGRCVDFLKNKGEVNEHKRALEYIKGTVVSCGFHFGQNLDSCNNMDANVECWGYWKSTRQVVIVGTVFDRILKQGGFQSRAFLSWAKANGVVEPDRKGNPKKLAKIGGTAIRSVFITFNDEEENEFTDEIDAEIPF